MLILQGSAWVSALSLAVNDDAAEPQRKKRRFAMQCKVVMITPSLSSIKTKRPYSFSSSAAKSAAFSFPSRVFLTFNTPESLGDDIADTDRPFGVSTRCGVEAPCNGVTAR